MPIVCFGDSVCSSVLDCSGISMNRNMAVSKTDIS